MNSGKFTDWGWTCKHQSHLEDIKALLLLNLRGKVFQDLIWKYRNWYQKRSLLSEFLHEARREKLLNLLLRHEGELTGEPPLSPPRLQLTAEIPFPFLVNNKYQRGQSHSHSDPWLYSHCLMSRRCHAQSMHEGLGSAEPSQAQRWLLPTLWAASSPPAQAARTWASVRSAESNWNTTGSSVAINTA